ncbi:MAG: Tfp pilus assembly protein FimT/FimU [Candidatus Sulfotelmatobacter sp.]|jgi:Tfp pilus assembly protein FimT
MFSRVAITPSKVVRAGSHMAPGGSVLHESGARSTRGFSLLELLIVVGISITIVAIAMPSFINTFYSIRLKSAASNLSALMQQARIQAARQNKIYSMAYNTGASPQQACIDLNNNGTCDPGETVITFTLSISMSTTGAPAGAGAPPAYVLVGDTAGTTYDNTTTLGYSPRGLPCPYAAGACPTPSPGYFVYYIKDSRVGSTGWAGVVVTRSGRTKPVIWNGAAWQ